ncbi:histidine kinase/DNA gyrase B/HSP90-like ATPase [Chryseobacterium sp. 52]|uniref:ATP-binding protein n=1 Tax=Chryseobacterium sp. 52 TaxID=2035213 RepID=UPI000C5126B0|nr:ATP-binding protein [Chryseobacterium sp. 52]PIF45948.1 histidine kinase/DNA gyrase B/HSP90-like ATPase [Chryseobacterium sp. 52]
MGKNTIELFEYKVQKNSVFKLDLQEIMDEIPTIIHMPDYGQINLDAYNLYYSPDPSFIGTEEIIIQGNNRKFKIRFDVVSTFKPKAHILILLGEELIKSSVMAIYELIKNSYDADSKGVLVKFNDIEDIEKATITITDSGTGITKEVLENVWFEPGTDFRKPIGTDGIRKIKRSPMFWRIPMGEKGVGRFAVHKLGHTINLVSRPAKVNLDEHGKAISVNILDYEVCVEIDWRKFSQGKYLEDVKINWSVKTNPDHFLFKNSHGTKITIGNLKEPWTRGMARQLKRHTMSMLSPKNDLNKFNINLDFGNWWLNDFPNINEVLESAPYKLIALVDENFELTFEYKFNLKNNIKIGSRNISSKSNDLQSKQKYQWNIKGTLRPYYKEFLLEKEYNKEEMEKLLFQYDSDSFKIPFGSLMIELYSYDLDSLSLRDYTTSPSFIKNTLKDHSGIKVFKQDLRIFDYGDPGNDWLGLDIKRVNNKTWFSNNQNIGYIYLDDETSSSLIEKTNREGFINNDSYDFFIILLEFVLDEFRSERLSDREKWLKFNKKGSDNSLEQQFSNFKEIVNNTDFTNEEKKLQILLEAEKIEERYTKDKETLLIPAGVGMTASFAMHEIEKLVPRMEESVMETPINTATIKSQVFELKDYVEGILSVVKRGGDKLISLKDSIEQAIKNYSIRLENYKITISLDYDANNENIKCDKRLLVTILMNLIDNSIYWLDTVYKVDKGIFIKTESTEKGISILFVDNGPGFKDNIEDIVRPFFTRKEGGIGIGMYLIDTVMMNYGKLNIISDTDVLKDKNVPDQYRGAAVELIFNKF